MTTENTSPDPNMNEDAKLSVQDLKQLAVIVDVAFRKGVFSADEAGPVSAVYSKLIAFVRQFDKKSSEAKEATQETKE